MILKRNVKINLKSVLRTIIRWRYQSFQHICIFNKNVRLFKKNNIPRSKKDEFKYSSAIIIKQIYVDNKHYQPMANWKYFLSVYECKSLTYKNGLLQNKTVAEYIWQLVGAEVVSRVLVN